MPIALGLAPCLVSAAPPLIQPWLDSVRIDSLLIYVWIASLAMQSRTVVGYRSDGSLVDGYDREWEGDER